MTNYIGDATEVMSTMSEDQYGAVVTSPPYNMGTGTTRLASQNLNVEADGIDLKEWV